MKNILHVEAGEDYMIRFAIHYANAEQKKKKRASPPSPSLSSSMFSSQLLREQSLSSSPKNYEELPYDVHFDLQMNSVQVFIFLDLLSFSLSLSLSSLFLRKKKEEKNIKNSFFRCCMSNLSSISSYGTITTLK